MILRSLLVQQYRNLETIELAPDPELTVFCGENGQGKTNLLESIWMLTGAKSFRTYREAELVRHGCSWCRIIGDVDTRADRPFPVPEKRIETPEDAAYRFAMEIAATSKEEQDDPTADAAAHRAFVEARRAIPARIPQEDIERMVAEDIENEAIEYRLRQAEKEQALRRAAAEKDGDAFLPGTDATSGDALAPEAKGQGVCCTAAKPAAENAFLPAAEDGDGYEPDRLEVTVRMDETGRRTLRSGRKNGVDYGSAANLAGHFCCVVFAPGHIQIVAGAPEGRRRFLDAALCQLYPGYLESLRRYLRTLQQKNSVLKGRRTMTHIPISHELLDSLDCQMSVYAKALMNKREAYCHQLAELTAARYDGISSGREVLQVVYRASVPNGESPGVMIGALRNARQTDIGAGYCTVGPHRDDIEFLLDGKPARNFASQGQCRSIALAVKIAELEMVSRVTGQTPVLLLDDVLSELDDARQRYLLTRIRGRQVFVTGCEPQRFAGVAGKIVTLEKGQIAGQETG